MIQKIVIPILAIIGFVMALRTVAEGTKPIEPAAPVAAPMVSPYESTIAGAAIVEPSSQNIAIGTTRPGIIAEVAVSVAQVVKKGDLLFAIDGRELEAELAVRQAAVKTAQERINRLKQLPRQENVVPIKAQVKELEVAVADAEDRLRYATDLSPGEAISREEVDRRRFALEAAKARLAQGNATLQELEAGAWEYDIVIATAELNSAEALLQSITTEIERLKVRAPIDGTVLQVNIRPGEYATAGAQSANPFILLGAVETLHARVDIDENDAWRFRSNMPATAALRGNTTITMPLEFVRVEPYIIPKRSLTGESTERVDTRVLQVIYRITPTDSPLYVGQLLDVSIQSGTRNP